MIRLGSESSMNHSSIGPIPSTRSLATNWLNHRNSFQSEKLKENQPGISTTKSIAVLVVVIGCILVLWPTIFYPMFRANFSRSKSNEQYRMHPSLMHPRLRDSQIISSKTTQSTATRHHGSSKNDLPPLHPYQGEGLRNRHPPIETQGYTDHIKSPGTMGLIVPIYTIIILIFFLYTIFKLVTKKDAEDENEYEIAGEKIREKSFPSLNPFLMGTGGKVEEMGDGSLKRRRNDSSIKLTNFGFDPDYHTILANDGKSFENYSEQRKGIVEHNDDFGKEGANEGEEIPSGQGGEGDADKNLIQNRLYHDKGHIESNDCIMNEIKTRKTTIRWSDLDYNPESVTKNDSNFLRKRNVVKPIITKTESFPMRTEGGPFNRNLAQGKGAQLDVKVRAELCDVEKQNSPSCLDHDQKSLDQLNQLNEKFDQMARNLTEKENAMGTLLNQINRSSSKLVQIGLLPSVPGLFTVGLSSNPHEHLDNTAKESLNDNQHAKSLPAHLVSSNLQSLVQNMELFKTYLIQVESCKMKLIQLQQDIEVITNGGDRSGLNIEQVDHRRVKTEVVESSSQTTKGEIESIVDDGQDRDEDTMNKDNQTTWNDTNSLESRKDDKQDDARGKGDEKEEGMDESLEEVTSLATRRRRRKKRKQAKV